MRFPAFRSFFILHFSFFIFFLLSIFYLLPSATRVYAASQSTPAQPTQYIPTNTNADVPNNLHNYTQNVMIEVMSSLTCQLTGVDPINPQGQCLGVDQKSGKIGFVQNGGGAIGVMGNMISMLYTPPLHTSDYFQNLASNFGIGKKTYAQSVGGTGFQSLTPLINIWSAFRNIVYLILVIIFVVIGLAIMLRIKIDPRTVMSIQNQIPKIIIGILAVTFSFAIAGFLIDMMWVFIYLFYGIFIGISPEVGKSVAELSPTAIQGKSAMGAVGGLGGIASITWTTGNSILGTVRELLGLDGIGGGAVNLSWVNILIHSVSVGVGFFVAFFTEGFKVAGFSVPGVQEAIKGGAAAVLVEAGLRWAIPYTIAYLVIFIALLTALFRLWFTLLMAYVYILLDVVLAPFWIIGGIVPGSPISFGGWIRDIAANLLAFPATITMFMLGKVFMDAFKTTPASGTQNFVPPLIGNPGDPSAIGALIGLGVLLMTPNIINMLKQMLKVPKLDTGGIGKALAPGLAMPGRAVGGAMSTTFAPHYDSKGQLVYPGGPIGRFLRGFGFVR